MTSNSKDGPISLYRPSRVNLRKARRHSDFDALTHAKSMLISPPDVAIEHLYSPFTEEKNRQLAGWFEY